jgi:L-malate glycosyltransferase
MKKILLISREFPPSLGGAGIAMYNYIKNIKSHHFTILSYFDPIFNTENINIKKLWNPFGFKKRYSSALVFMISSLVDCFGKYDYIIGNAFVGASVGSIAKYITKKPLISIIHDVDYVYSKDCKYGKLNKSVRKFLFNRIFSKSEIIIVPNKIILEDIKKIFGEKITEKVKILTLGVDLEEYKKIEKPAGKQIMLFVGAVRRNKGLDYLIRAFKEVSEKFKNLEFWIIGSIVEQEHYKKLLELSQELKIEDKIKFLGAIKHYEKKNVFSYYDIADIVVFGSYYSERFGIPCVEASLMEKPIVATDIFEENGVIVNEKTGLVVPKKDSKEMSKAIIRILENDELGTKLGKQAKTYSSKFTTEHLSKEFEKIIKVVEN